MEGYIKLWRRMLDSEEWLSLSSDQRCVMFTLLMIADWQAHPGVVSITERKLADRARVDRRVVQRTLSRLCKTGFLRREGQDQGQDQGQGVVPYSVVKWEDYQDAGTNGGQNGAKSGPLSIYEEERRKKGESARDPSATYQDEIRQLERNRQHAAAPPQRHDDGYEQVISCPECGHPMRLIRGKLGPFYRHPPLVGLGCQAKFNAEDLHLVLEAAQRKTGTERHPVFCLGCSEHALPGQDYCASCLVIAKECGKA